MTATLTDDHYERDTLTADDLKLAGDGCAYDVGDNVGPKFSSVAAHILWCWSLDSGQDETAGEAELGNGWNALFREERAILNTGSSGFVHAWRVDDGTDLDAYWADVESNARYMDDDESDE